MTPTTSFSPDQLTALAENLLDKLGVPGEDAALIARAVLQADLEGVETHGFARLPNYLQRIERGIVNPSPTMHVVRKQGATAVIDANNGMGQVAAAWAMGEAIRMARTHGTGWVGVRNSGHFGVASFYCGLAVEAGMIGVALSNSPPAMAPAGGRTALLGTNPIGVGVPAGERPPILIDLATSHVARGHVLKAAREGRSIPDDWALDAAGQPTTDPAAALKGVLLPMAGAKGYALALAVELLCGALTGAAISPEIPSFFDNFSEPSNVGHMLGAIDVAAFLEPAAFYARVAALTDLLKASPPAADSLGVRIPGERRAAAIARRRREGLSYAPATIQQLRELAERLGVDWPG